VNIASLEQRFDAGTEVTIELMKANGLATAGTCREGPRQGELSKALTVHAHAFSASAREQIEAPAAPAPSSRLESPGRETGSARERIH